MASPDRIILTAAALLSAVNGNPVWPTQIDSPDPQASSLEQIKTPETVVPNESFFESNFTSSTSLEDLIAESERQGKPFFPFAMESPDDIDMSVVEGEIFITAKNPIVYLSNTDGMLYAGKYGQKITVPRHIDLSINSGMFTIEEIDAEKKTKINTQFYFHESDFRPLWIVGKSRQKFEKGQPLFTFSGSRERGNIPQDTLVLTIKGIPDPLAYFAQKDGKILYLKGVTPNKA